MHYPFGAASYIRPWSRVVLHTKYDLLSRSLFFVDAYVAVWFGL